MGRRLEADGATPGGSPRRVARFDGLRAVLVLAVMAHHMEATFKGSTAPVFKAGWLPVEGFFVLSGYLVTTVLSRDVAQPLCTTRTARSGWCTPVARFLGRRVMRLLPALLVVLAAIGLVSVNADHRPWRDVWPSLASAASYVHNVNYLRISPLLTEVGPYWSLSVEMQFYVAFALVALVLWRLGASPAVWVGVVVAVAIGSAAWRAALGVAAYPRSYLSTPARLDALMWGVLVTLAAQWGWLTAVPRRVLATLAAASIAVLVWMYARLHAFDPRTYEWGIAVSGVGSAVVVAWLVADDASWLARGLGWAPLAALGRRSYSAYLWHQAVFLFLWHHTASGPWTRPIVGFAATFVLADFTYRLVERPGIDWSHRPRRVRRIATVRIAERPPLTRPEPAV